MLLANYATVVVVCATLNTGRSTTDGVNSFCRRSRKLELAGRNQNRPVSVLRRKTCGLVALLAAALSWASIQGFPKGSGQGSRATTAISIFPSVHSRAPL